MCFTNGRITFSVKMDAGASSAPEAVDRMADSSAPKNIACAHSGVCASTASGRMRWISRGSSDANSCVIDGSMVSAA